MKIRTLFLLRDSKSMKIMRTYLIFFSIAAFLTACGKTGEKTSSGESKSGKENVSITNKITTGNWDYINIKKTVLEVFPEAYPEFFEVTFEDHDNQAFPKTASFCVPDKYFPAPLSEEELDKRAKLLTEKFEYIGCERANVGEPSEYSWGAWEDKKVRRVTFYFGIGC